MGGFATLFSDYDVLAAFWTTVKLTVYSAVGAALIGTLVGVLRVSPVTVLRSFGTTYVNLVRNTPLALIVFFCAFGISNTLGVVLAPRDSPTFIVDNNFRFGLIALAVYHAAFVAEALRSGINTVPPGQAEAARSIGLTFLPILRYVVLPQATRGAVAPLGNTLIALTKNTTVVSTIGVVEASYLMKTMMESNIALLFQIFAIMAGGFVL